MRVCSSGQGSGSEAVAVVVVIMTEGGREREIREAGVGCNRGREGDSE